MKVVTVTKIAPKALAKAAPKKFNKGLFVAEAMAGISLLATLAGYSLFLVKHDKKIDVKKMKLNVLNTVKKAEKSVEGKIKQLRK